MTDYGDHFDEDQVDLVDCDWQDDEPYGVDDVNAAYYDEWED